MGLAGQGSSSSPAAGAAAPARSYSIYLRLLTIILATLAMGATLYGENHPYGRPQYGTPTSLKAIARDDLDGFYRARIRPDRATLIAVGDVTPDEVVEVLEKSLAGWKSAGGGEDLKFPAIPAARPSGKGCCSSLMKRRFKGKANSTPSTAMAIIQHIVTGIGRTLFVTSM